MLKLGAVAYDPRVVPIWEGMREYFREAGVPTDYVLFSSYDAQVDALLSGWIDVAWNTNLAYVKVHRKTGGRCRVLAMRDTDVAFTSVLVARADAGVRSLEDVRGKRVALGSADSAQAAILPLHYLRGAGVDGFTLQRFDVDVGKHGDTGTSELDVLRALREGAADVGALGEATWAREVAEGRVDEAQLRSFWRSPGYCHCNFTVMPDFPEDRAQAWKRALLAQDYNDPRWRPIMDLEGLKRWVEPALAGYDVLFQAVEEQDLARAWAARG